MAGFVDVLLRGIALAGQSAAVGGVLFALLVLRPLIRSRPALAPLLVRSRRLIALGAAVAAIAQALSLTTELRQLADGRGWPLVEMLSTTFFQASFVRITACLGLIVACRALRRGIGWGGAAALVAPCLVLGAGAAMMSHAAGRVDHRGILVALDALHQLSVAAWIGGLLQLGASALGRGGAAWPGGALRRFSALAFGSVLTLLAAGVGLTVHYVDDFAGLVGTAYGMMVVTKVVLFAALMGLGGMNFLLVRKLPPEADVLPLRLRRFVEVELGLGITVLFAAASLTSLPPAVDIVADRATLDEVMTRFTPRLPTLASPALADMPLDDREAPRTDADRAWSEYNHHFAGLFVLAMGLLAVLQAAGVKWARHWPLLFLGLAGFLLVRNDPGSWPLGPQGFWEGFRYPEVFQHRLFVLVVVAFGLFEWAVRTRRLTSRRWALTFPALCAIAGGLLLTHSHAALNLRDEYLIEVTHAPLGVLAMVTGWSRWLELRLPPPDARIPSRIWPIAFALVGILLVLYRES